MDWSIVPEHRYLQVLLTEKTAASRVPLAQSEPVRHEYDRTKVCLLPLDGAECFLCRNLACHRHHVRPISRGGTNEIDNLVALCSSCYKRVNDQESQRETSYTIARWQAKEHRKLQRKRHGCLISKST